MSRNYKNDVIDQTISNTKQSQHQSESIGSKSKESADETASTIFSLHNHPRSTHHKRVSSMMNVSPFKVS